MGREGISPSMGRNLRAWWLEGGFRWVKPSASQLPSPTVVFAVQPRLYDVVELEDEGAWRCEEPSVVTDVFGMGPNDPISSGGFGGGGAPD